MKKSKNNKQANLGRRFWCIQVDTNLAQIRTQTKNDSDNTTLNESDMTRTMQMSACVWVSVGVVRECVCVGVS